MAKRTLHVLDLRRPSRLSGLLSDVLSRLAFEEFLFRYDPYSLAPFPKASETSTSTPPEAFGRDWLLMGTHSPHLTSSSSPSGVVPPCVVVLGLGGKVPKLVDVPLARRDGVPLVRRFSGGGTVVVDGSDTLLTALIVRTWGGGRQDDPNVCKPFPREIMDWTADAVFGPTFASMAKGLPPSPDSTPPPPFTLLENDYTLGGLHKIAGNAQCIAGPGRGWLHHTSFLWSYLPSNMSYLLLPEKRPAYREGRPHNDFIGTLSKHYGGAPGGAGYLFDHLRRAVGCAPLNASSSSRPPSLEDCSSSFKASYCGSVDADPDEVLSAVLRKVGGVEGWRAFVRGESVADQNCSSRGAMISRSKIIQEGDEEEGRR